MNEYGNWSSPSIYEINQRNKEKNEVRYWEEDNYKNNQNKNNKQLMTNAKIDKIKEKQATTVINRNVRKQSKSDIDYTLDGSVKQLFLNLTKMQIPFDYEQTLVHLFPKGMKTDVHGNYFIKVGESKTMFCGHMDTYCYEYKQVFHVIDGDIIKTDGSTTLGGDDKAGIVIMIYMINAGIPGLYYFFRGEEGVTSPTGTWGSKQALKTYEDIFKTYEKCVAFDRRGTTSVITQQMYSFCCSDEFAGTLVDEFKKNGLNYDEDPTGMWCDSGVFMDLIPECTNISVGYKDEHTFHEEQDIAHLEKLVQACLNINWEKLPVKRDPTEVKSIGRYNFDTKNSWDRDYDRDYYNSGNREITKKFDDYGDKFVKKYKTMNEVFVYATSLLYELGYECLNPDDFAEGDEMYFQNYTSQEFFAIKIVDYDIYMSEDQTLRSYDFIGNINTFESYITFNSEPDDTRHLDAILNADDKKVVRKEEDDETEIYFDKNQDKTFSEFVTNNPDVLSKILTIISEREDGINNTEWMEVDKRMYDEGVKVDYAKKGGINPDELVDWIFFNWSKCEKIKREYDKDQKNKQTLSYGIGGVGFTKEQNSIFSDIAINKFPQNVFHFIEQVIDKDIIKLVSDGEKYKATITAWIDGGGYEDKRKNKPSVINYMNFLNWLIKNSEDIKSILEE